MAEENTSEESEQRYVMGKERPEPETIDEAGGRSKRDPYVLICSNDGAVNYFDGTWQGTYICWKCGTVNSVK